MGNTRAVTSCVLAASPESARAARHFTREILLSWGFGDLLDEAETIIGELVVNAVQHGSRDAARISWRSNAAITPVSPQGRGYPRAWARNSWSSGPIQNSADYGTGPSQLHQDTASEVLKLCLLRRMHELMLAVIDASDDAPTPRQPDWVGESGRGLQIVDALSSVWGWSPIDGHGKAVWAVLPVVDY